MRIFETVFVDRSGHSHYALLNLQRVDIFDVPCILTVARDITDDRLRMKEAFAKERLDDLRQAAQVAAESRLPAGDGRGRSAGVYAGRHPDRIGRGRHDGHDLVPGGLRLTEDNGGRSSLYWKCSKPALAASALSCIGSINRGSSGSP